MTSWTKTTLKNLQVKKSDKWVGQFMNKVHISFCILLKHKTQI